MPPVLYLQGTADAAHPRPNLNRFIAGYRKAIEKIIEFVHREIR